MKENVTDALNIPPFLDLCVYYELVLEEAIKNYIELDTILMVSYSC